MTKGKPARHNNPKIDDLHSHLMKMTDGKDPSQITGLSDKSLMELIAETGIDLKSTWKTEKHFVSWVCLAPSKHQSGKSNKRFKKKGHTNQGRFSVMLLIHSSTVNILH